MENQYNTGHAREILEPCGSQKNYLRFDERGVWPAIERDPLLLPETEGLRWRPARELQHLPGAPEVNDTPTLPNPFNARELAAFMLEGVGALVQHSYGEWSDGPDPDRLSGIDPDSRARRAVIEAFAAYRLAIEKVGKWDADALARRDAAHKAYWGTSKDKALLKALEDAEAEWDATYQTWLTAMVVCLLEPRPQAATTAPAAEPPAPAQTTAAPAPVVADSASDAPVIGPPPVATRRIAFAFDGLRGWNEQAWKDTLGSPPKWLQACIVFRGQQGVRETHWNPVLIGASLVRNGHAKQNSVRARFQSRPQLEGWKEAWKTYEADNFDTQ